jgi:hypothetical protein
MLAITALLLVYGAEAVEEKTDRLKDATSL